MNKKDRTQKTLEQYNDIFADILNVLLFDGKPLIEPDELSDATTYSQYKLDGEGHGQERDVAKYWKNGQIRIALVGLENQTDPVPDMPLRVIGYDGAAYRGQLNRDGDGKLSKERYPVVTLVLYFGYKYRWPKRRSLKECFEIPEELDAYVSDYRINVFEIAFLERETIDKFRSDFWILADYCYQMQTTGTYELPHKQMRHPEEVFDALSAFSNDQRYREQFDTVIAAHEEGNKMPIDSWFDQVVPAAEARGEARGEARMLKLFECLRKDDRLAELDKATKDPTVLRELYREYGIEGDPEEDKD